MKHSPYIEGTSSKLILGLVFGLLLLLLSGCGGRSSSNPSNCNLTSLNVFPTAGTADHAAVAPGNQQQFTAFGVVPSGCVQVLSNLTTVTWSVSDPVNVSISNVQGPTYGVATCTGATVATVTGTAPNNGGGSATGSASLTCK